MIDGTVDLMYAPHSSAVQFSPRDEYDIGLASEIGPAAAQLDDDPDLADMVAISYALVAAHELLAARRNQEAIEAYHALRTRIFALISPFRPASWALPVGFRPPHDLAHMDHMFEASVNLIVKPEPVPPRQAPWKTLTGEALGGFERATQAGVHTKIDLDGGAVSIAQVAAGLGATGDWQKAAEHYREAVDAAPEGSPLKATLLVNLGGALVQAGKADAAADVLGQATQAFEAAGDDIGRAQAVHNLGVVAATRGDADEASARFEEADAAAVKAFGGAGAALGVATRIGRLESGGLGALRASVLEGIGGRLASTHVLRRGPLGGGLVVGNGGEEAPETAARAATQFASGYELVFPAAGDSSSWATASVVSPLKSKASKVPQEAGLVVGDDIARLAWRGDDPPRAEQLRDLVYESRVTATLRPELDWSFVSVPDVAGRLAHLYYYVIPVALADAYNALGDWSAARTWYFNAADYRYLNPTLEAPVLWQRIAATYLAEGDALYQEEEPQKALDVYGKVLKPDRTIAAGEKLYTHAKLGKTGKLVGEFMPDPKSATADPGAGVRAVVLDLAHRLIQIAAGLDWFGMPANLVPPFTFPYLQSAASHLARQAQAAERDYVQFMDHYDTARLNRMQLQHAATSAHLESAVATAQREAADEEVTLAEDAKALANERHANAVANRADYAAMADEQIALETSSAWYGSQNEWELGNPIPGDGRQIHEVMADNRERLGEISRDYELARMDRAAEELELAEKQAAQQVAVSEARAAAARMAEMASQVRAAQAAALVSAFDANTFTPDVWRNMAEFMRGHSRRYLYWATRVARLMERAYEFENDTSVDRIRIDYSGGVVAGLFGADQLLADIDYFTFLQITQTRHRTLRATKRVSLAERFPYAFQTQMRRTGRMSFQTSLADIEREYPGSFGHRIQAAEVRIVGLIPREGVHGILRNGGVSQYRSLDGSEKWRVQDVDTMLLSAYTPGDAGMFRPRPEQMNVFEGIGLAGSWELEIPARSNDVDYAFLVDIELVLHYEARFDRRLADRVRKLPTPAELLRASRSTSLRWDFPDRFFLLHSTGATTLDMSRALFPHHHVKPKVRSVSLQVLGRDGAAPPANKITLSAPGGTDVTVTPGSDGRVAASDPALAALAGKAALGSWSVAMEGDAAARAKAHDVLLFLEYDYSERAL